MTDGDFDLLALNPWAWLMLCLFAVGIGAAPGVGCWLGRLVRPGRG